MIPFSGFMQANTGTTVLAAGKTVNMGKNANGQPNNVMANMLSTDDAASFPEWVRTLMTGGTSLQTDGTGMQTEGESILDVNDNDLEREMPGFDQLQAVIGDTLEQSTDEPIAVLDMMAHMRGEGKQLEQQAFKEAGVDHSDSRRPPLNHAPKVLAAVQKMMAAGNNGSDGGQLRTSATELGSQAQPSDQALANQSEHAIKTGNDSQIKGIPLTPENIEKTSVERVEKDASPSIVKSEAPAVEAAKNDLNQIVQARPASGQERFEKASDAVATPKDSMPGPNKPPISLETALTDHQSASSDDDAASSRNTANSSPAQRSGLEHVDENEGHKGQSPDSVKSTGAEFNRSQATFQESAKAVMVDRSSPGQAATMARTEEPAARSFQTTVMDQIVDKASLRSVQGRSEIQIRLKPDFLGNVQMNIATDKEQIVVRVITDRPVVKEIIETNLHQLKSELQNQGLTIDKFDVMVNPDADHQHSREQFAQMFKNSSFPNGRRQPHEGEAETTDRDDKHERTDDQPGGDGVNYFA